MIRKWHVAGTVLAALAMPVPARASHAGWVRTSNIGRDVVVAAALGVPAITGDWRGGLQAGASMLAAEGGAQALKALVRERRPDDSDMRSFPSGHAAVSFAAAATLEKRYGWQAGLPAFTVAALVGTGRVAGDKHYVHDVIAGAAMGVASGLLLTNRQSDAVRLTPWGAHGGGGISLSARW